MIWEENAPREIVESVASLRLDNLVSAAFSVSRSKAAEAAAAGLIFVDGIHVKKPDRLMREGEKIVFRGKARRYFPVSGEKAARGRIMVSIEKYR